MTDQKKRTLEDDLRSAAHWIEMAVNNGLYCGTPWSPDRIDQANSRLLAAAPDLLAEVKELRAATTWQPIETAPKERMLLAWCPAEKMVFEAFWLTDVEHWLRSGAGGNSEPFNPTHWMPLPQPPEDAA